MLRARVWLLANTTVSAKGRVFPRPLVHLQGRLALAGRHPVARISRRREVGVWSHSHRHVLGPHLSTLFQEVRCSHTKDSGAGRGAGGEGGNGLFSLNYRKYIFMASHDAIASKIQARKKNGISFLLCCYWKL